MKNERVFLAYIPVVHAGILGWLRSNPLPVYVLAEELISEFPQLKHDLRAVKPSEAALMLISLGFVSFILNKDILSGLRDKEITFVLPQDEVMIQFAEKYLIGRKCEFCPTFIRWDKINTTSENDPNPDLQISIGQFEKEVLSACVKQAELSSDWWRQVGVAVVRDGKVLLFGVNRHKPTDYSPYIDGDIRGCFGWGERLEICGSIHAEAQVIARAARLGIPLEGCDFYCTTLPCPKCARLLEEAKVSKVFYLTGYSVCDAFEILKSANITVVKVVDE